MFQRARLLLIAIVTTIMGVSLMIEANAAVKKLPEYALESGISTHREISVAKEWTNAISSANAVQQGPVWFDNWLSGKLPFSFKYQGKDSDGFLGQWKREKKGNELLSWTDPATGLNVQCHIKGFTDYPAVEWVLTFKNTGDKDTGIVEDIDSLRMGFKHSQEAKGYNIYGANGGRAAKDDMMPFIWHSNAQTGENVLKFPEDTSSNRMMPFWNIETPENKGVVVAFGWTGAWSAEMKVTGKELGASARMRDSHFVLHPGEEVRSPRVLLVLWEGQRMHGNNMLRQVLYKHYLLPNKGYTHQNPLVTVNFCFTHHSAGGYLTEATEQTLKPLIEPFLKIGAEAFVVDAGWYKCKEWGDIGKDWSFTISRDRWPNGFKPISEPLKLSGVPFGLWFASESGRDFGKPEVREEFLSLVDSMAKNEDMTYYRQDGGTGWADADPNRKGIDQIRRITGIYEVWDQISKRHPGILMEGCSGGGRRIDLETIQRFSWIQKSDRWFDSNSDQCSIYGASQFLPGGVLNLPTQLTDDYAAWSSFGGQFCLGWHPIDRDFPTDQAKLQVERYKRIRSLLSGDFYPMTPCGLTEEWMAYQFHRVDLDTGFALAFRRAGPKDDKLKLVFKGLDPKKFYEVHFEAANRDTVLTGHQLAALDVTIGKAPGAEMITYKAE